MLASEHLTIEQLDNMDVILQKASTKTSFSWAQYFFYYLQILLPNRNMTVPFACLLMMVSLSQLVGIFVNSRTHFGENSPPLEGFMLSFFQGSTVYYLISAYESSTFYFAALYMLISVMALLVLMGIWSRIFPKGNIAYLLQLAVPIFYWIGLTPTTLLLFSIWNCPGPNHPIAVTLQCWDTPHIVHLTVVSVFIVLWLCLMIPVITFLMGYADSHRDNALAHLAWCFEINYAIIRICVCIIEGLAETRATFYILIGIILVTLVYFFSFTSNSFTYYDRVMAITFSTCILSATAICAVNLLLNLISSLHISVAASSALVFIIGFLSYIIVTKLRKKRTRSLIERQIYTCPEDLDAFVMMYSYKKIWNYYVEDVDDKSIEGFLAIHAKQCNSPECPLCNKNQLVLYLPLKGIDTANSPQMVSEGIVQRHFLAYLWSDKRHKDISDIRALLQLSRIYLFLLGNPHKAYAKLMEAASMDPSWIMQFIIFTTKMDIIAFIESRKKSLYKKGTCNFTKVMELESILDKMRRTVVEATERRFDFWNQLKMPKPSLNVLRDTGYAFLEVSWRIKKCWKSITDIYPTHVKAMELYIPYLLYVLGEPDEALSLQERMDDKQDIRDWKEIDTHSLFSDRAASILISASQYDAGRIIKASEKVADLFDFNPDELVGRDITILMPKIIGQAHSGFLKNYFKAGMEKRSKPYISTFGLNNAGYIFPLKVAQQQICTFQLGMTHVGIVQRDIDADFHDYIITNCTGKIEGISKSLGELMGIKPGMINTESVLIQYLCEQTRFDKPSEYEELSGSKRLTFNIPKDLKRMISNDSFKKLYNRLSRIASPKQSRSAEKRSSQLDVRQDIDSTNITAKCEISNLSYDGDAVRLKVFQFPKTETMNQNEDEVQVKEGMHLNIMDEVVRSLKSVKKKHGALVLSKRVKLRAPGDKKDSNSSLEPRKSDKLHQFVTMFGLGTGKTPLAFIQKLLQSRNKKANDEQNNGSPDNSQAEARRPVPVPPLKLDISHADEDEKTPLTSQPQPPPEAKVEKVLAQTVPGKKPAPAQAQAVLRNDIDTMSVSTQSKSMSKILKQIRTTSFSGFYPRSVFRLNWMGRIFIGALFVLVATRALIGVYYTVKLKMFPSLLVYNAYRLTAIVKITKSIIHLLLLEPDASGNTMIDLATRSGYNYNEFKSPMEPENITNFKEWTISNLRVFTPKLQDSEEQINAFVDNFEPKQRAQIDPDSMPIVYPIGQQFFKTYYLSAKGAVMSVVDHCYKLLNMTKSGGKFTSTDFTTMFAKEASTNELLEGVAYSIIGLMDACTILAKVHQQISLSILIGVGCVLGVFVVVLFPFLTVVNKDLAASLRMLLKIKKTDVRGQLSRLHCFVEYTIKGDTKREKLEEENVEDVESQQAAQTQSKSAKSSGAETAAHHRPKKDTYIPYKGNQYKVMFAMLLLCGSLIGLYIGLDKTIDYIVANLLVQLEEIARYSRLISGNTGFLSNIYQYIMTQRTGFCNRMPCLNMLVFTIGIRQAQLTDFVVGHKFNVSIFAKEYNEIFHTFIESNPCETTVFSGKEYCYSLMNGIFSHGAAAANIAFYDYGASIFTDYSLVNLSTTGVSKFVNDRRLIDIEMLHESLLEPAYNYILERLRELVLQKLENSVSVILLFFAGFIVIFIISGFIGWRLLIISMNRSIFDTKVIIANLPPEIITANNAICEYLTLSKTVDQVTFMSSQFCRALPA